MTHARALQILGPLADLRGRIRAAEGHCLLPGSLARRTLIEGQGFDGGEEGKAAQKGQGKE